MITDKRFILLADDDIDDCLFFKEALEELELSTELVTVHDGEQLMQHLKDKADRLPNVLFLDLNMPRKNGFTCLEEIKRSERLKELPFIIFSTSYDKHIADQLYKNGAQYYICKPTEFSQLKKVILQALTLTMHVPHETILPGETEERSTQPPRDKFILGHLKSSLP